MEALAACFYICGHEDWAIEVLQHFSYGKPFLEINSQLLKRYAACSNAEEVKKAEENWLAKIEREYSKSRSEKGQGSEDAWAGGNTNRLETFESDSENDNSSDDESDQQDEAHGAPLIPDEEDDEEEMAELRRKVLASKPFTNPSAQAVSSNAQRGSGATGQLQRSDSESKDESGSDDEGFEEFDTIVNATPVTDRTGILAKQRQRRLESTSASFSRTSVDAPKKW